MTAEEYESDVRIGLAPISDVLKIELCRFSALPYNKKPIFRKKSIFTK